MEKLEWLSYHVVKKISKISLFVLAQLTNVTDGQTGRQTDRQTPGDSKDRAYGSHRAVKMTSCRFSRWRISAILDFSGPIISSLKSPRTTFYRSSIETIALNCLVFDKIAFLYFGDRQTNRQTDEQMDRPVA